MTDSLLTTFSPGAPLSRDGQLTVRLAMILTVACGIVVAKASPEGQQSNRATASPTHIAPQTAD